MRDDPPDDLSTAGCQPGLRPDPRLADDRQPEWKHAKPLFYPAYAKALQTLAGPKIGGADVTSMWLALLERKSVLDLSGNGLNHPNDFGHRVYADVVLSTLAGPSPRQ